MYEFSRNVVEKAGLLIHGRNWFRISNAGPP